MSDLDDHLALRAEAAKIKIEIANEIRGLRFAESFFRELAVLRAIEEQKRFAVNRELKIGRLEIRIRLRRSEPR